MDTEDKRAHRSGEVSMSKRCVRLGNSHCEKEMIKGNFYDVGRNGWE